MRISDELAKVVDVRQGNSPFVTDALGHSDYMCRRRELESGRRVNTLEIPEGDFVYLITAISKLREKLSDADATRREFRKGYATCRCGKKFEKRNMIFIKNYGHVCVYCVGE